MEQKEIDARNAVLEEKKEMEKLLRADIQQVHDENKADWVRSLRSAADILKKKKGDFSSADQVVIAGQMVVVMTNRRMAQRAVEARRQQLQESSSRGGLIRPQVN